MFNAKLGAGFICFLEFSPRKSGKIFTHFDEHIFQMGWNSTTNQKEEHENISNIYLHSPYKSNKYTINTWKVGGSKTRLQTLGRDFLKIKRPITWPLVAMLNLLDLRRPYSWSKMNQASNRQKTHVTQVFYLWCCCCCCCCCDCCCCDRRWWCFVGMPNKNYTPPQFQRDVNQHVRKNVPVGGDCSSLGFTDSHPKGFAFSFLTENPSFFDESIPEY